MKFHARLSPGIVTDLDQPLELTIHRPRRAGGVTIKIWELDTFTDQDGTTREGTEDDLLATFEGAIEPGGPQQADPDWRCFRVARHHIEPGEPEHLRFSLRFPGGDEVYEIPIRSEKGEVEGRAFELGFSIEHGGGEQFRATCPVLVDLPRVPVRVIRRWIRDHDAAPDPERERREPVALQWAAIGTASGEGLDARLDIAGVGFLDASGLLLVSDPAERADGDPPPRPLLVRRDRRLLLYLLDEPCEERGASSIPADACYPLSEDGVALIDEVEPAATGVWMAAGLLAAVIQQEDSATLPSIFEGASEVSASDLAFDGPPAFSRLFPDSETD